MFQPHGKYSKRRPRIISSRFCTHNCKKGLHEESWPHGRELSTNDHMLLAKVSLFLVGFALSVWAVIVTRAQQATPIEIQGKVQSLCNGTVGIFVLALYFALAMFDSAIGISALYVAEAIVALSALMLITRVGEDYVAE